MESSTKESLEDLVVERILEQGGSVDVPRGKFMHRNVARTLRLSGFNRRAVYEAVVKAIRAERITREDLPQVRGQIKMMRLSVIS
jgi:hypothetical protein